MNITKAKASKCVTHFYGCSCSEYKFHEMEKALKLIQGWAEHYEDSIAETVLHDIERKCKEALEG
jgi:hypothetical protein